MVLTKLLNFNSFNNTVFLEFFHPTFVRNHWKWQTAEKCHLCRFKNIKNNSTSDCFRERKHLIGCVLTCDISKKTSVYKPIHYGDKKRV